MSNILNKYVTFSSSLPPPPPLRWLTTAAIMDYDTVAGADKFGNVCLIRLPSDCNDDVEADDPSGNKVLWARTT